MSDVVFNNPQETKKVTAIFYGINKQERIPDGCFKELYNMTGDKYPCLAVRSERANMRFGEAVQVGGEPIEAIDVDGRIAVLCSNGIIKCFGEEFDTGSYGNSMVRFNKKIFVFPSGAYLGSDGIKFASAQISGVFNCEARDSAGNTIEITTGAKPSSPESGQYWKDSETGGVYRYSAVQEEWTAVPLLYCNVKLQNADIISGDILDFNVGDGIQVHNDFDGTDISTFVSAVSEEDGLTFETDLPYTKNAAVMTIKRICPELQFCCAHNNRMWGCSFSDTVNEIYASKLGDPLNWNCFRGLSTDSYALSVGEPGEFTGCVSFGDRIIFFKEMCMFTVYGTEPSNFQTVKTDCFGVQKGSERSIVRINGQLYYKSCHGIMRMSEGGLPVCISDDLGPDVWKDAVAGTDGSKYYVAMTGTDGKREMFVYDTSKEMWHKENLPAGGMFSMIYHKNNLLLVGKSQTDITAKSIRKYKENQIKRSDYINNSLYLMALSAEIMRRIVSKELLSYSDEKLREIYSENEGREVTDEEFAAYLDNLYEMEQCYVHNLTFFFESNELTCNELLLEDDERIAVRKDEGRFHWTAETGLRGVDAFENKRLKSVEVLMKLDSGARCDVSIEYDGSGRWESFFSFEDKGMKTFRIKDRLDKCNTYRLRFQGYGKMVLYGISEVYEEAGNIGF